MESVSDLLGRYSPKEPDEVVAVKRYISETFQSPSSVALKGETLIITVQSASLANTLRLRALALQSAAKTTKRLIFRIG